MRGRGEDSKPKFRINLFGNLNIGNLDLLGIWLPVGRDIGICDLKFKERIYCKNLTIVYS